MTIRHLKVFIKVCECDYSISKASQELSVAQPSVSQTIKELENFYDVTLFERANRKLILTKEGELLLNKAKEVISRFDEFEILANNKDLNPTIKIGSTMTFGAFVLPRFKELLNERYPNLDPKFMVERPIAIEEKILLGELDFAFVEGLIKNNYINALCIGDDELVAVCAPNYNAPDKMRIVDLVKYPLGLREKDNPSRRILDYHLAIKGVKITSPLLESISNNCILSLAIEGNGIGIVPAPIARRWLLNGKIRKIELDVPLKRKLFLITHKNKTMNASTLKAYNLAKEILGIVRKEREEKDRQNKTDQ